MRAWKPVFIVLLLCALVPACGPGGGDSAPPPPPPAEPAPPPSVDEGNTTQVRCAEGDNGTLPVTVSPQIPAVPVFAQGSGDQLEVIQCGFDVFSWNSFLAVSHSPQGTFGDRDGDNTTVWEIWPEASDIFLPNGEAPPPWTGDNPPPPHQIPSICTAMWEPGMKVLSQVAKRPDILESTNQPFDSGPLIDIHGYYSRFEITVNQEMYQYTLDNRLYSREGQAAFAADGKTVDFPCGCTAASAAAGQCADGGQQGAIMVKAAWKILDTEATPPDDPATFHTAHAVVYTPAQGDQPPTCDKQRVGLVGLHIGHKTQHEPQWTWSTFEHVKNAPTQGEAVPAGSRYNYFQPDCTDCNAVNKPPPQPWDAHDQPVTANSGKSQVERAIPIPQATRAMNTQVQGILANTVWLNYELVSTQWPTNGSGTTPGSPSAENGWCDPLNAVDKAGNPAPVFLANTTLETYIQGTVPQASSSCINCHLNAATTAPGNDNFSDFTYLLERAQ